MSRVAVTGVGMVSALGSGGAAHLEALQSGSSGLGTTKPFALEGLPPAPVGVVSADVLQGIPSARSVALARLAAEQALHGAAPSPGGILALGTTTGGIFEGEQHYLRHRGQTGAADRELLRHHPTGAIADVLAKELRLTAERMTFSTACSSSANALGYAALRVRAGAPWALAGGVDSLSRLTYSGFHSLKLLSTVACRPFDAHRQGLSLGEAAAFLLLEDEGRARARGARVLGFLAGWGCTSDAYHVTAPHPEGLGALTAMQAALADAGLGPTDVDYVNAHGTATPANDRAEATALAALFGAEAPPTSSTKGATGHTLGAAGALEAALCLLVLSSGYAPATTGLAEPDPALPVHHVPRGGLEGRFRVALSNSFGFGGNNAALVLTGADS